MSKLIDYTGQRFGRLTVVEQMPAIRRKARWLCRCDCGAEVVKSADHLRRGHAKSCGCLRSDMMREKATSIAGHYHEKLHGVWNSMKQRCSNPNSKDFKYYGAAGVTVCAEWMRDYLSFREWALSYGYREGLTIDRINPFGNYEPANCRWISIQEQQKNKRTSAWRNI